MSTAADFTIPCRPRALSGRQVLVNLPRLIRTVSSQLMQSEAKGATYKVDPFLFGQLVERLGAECTLEAWQCTLRDPNGPQGGLMMGRVAFVECNGRMMGRRGCDTVAATKADMLLLGRQCYPQHPNMTFAWHTVGADDDLPGALQAYIESIIEHSLAQEFSLCAQDALGAATSNPKGGGPKTRL